jgi:hypothetical protein
LALTLALAGCLSPTLPPAPGPAPPGDCDLAALRTRALGAQPCNVEVTTTNGPASEVSMALDPANPLRLVAGAKDATLADAPGCDVNNVWAGHYWSADGGRTWGNGLFPGHPGEDRGPLAAFTCSSDPVVAFGPDGSAYYTGIGVELTSEAARPALGLLGGARSVIWVARSDDGGATWGTPAFAADCMGPACFNDKQWIAVDPRDGTLYLTWALVAPIVQDPVVGGAGTLHIVASRSDDRGATWTAPSDVSPPIRGNVLNQFNTPVVGNEGEVYVFWIDLVNSALVMARSDDRGATWGLPVAIATVTPLPFQLPNSEFRTPTLTTAAIDRGSGMLYVAWPDAARGHGDILLARSEDGGASWHEPVRLNQDAGDHDQFFPSLSVAPDGRVDALFYDRRDDPANRLVTAYHAWSTDHGATWQEVRVGDVLFDGDLGQHQTGAPYLGDYISIASSDAAAHMVWADSRNGDNDLFFARLPH